MHQSIADFCRFLSDFGLTEDNIFDCRLVANELLGNVLRHAKTQACFQGDIADGYVQLLVQSNSPFVPPEKSVCSDVYSEHGRGLFLVDSVCAERVYREDGSIVIKIKINP
jgi:anti-sigma regulatory factor (Ser/Thr protein kinase)